MILLRSFALITTVLTMIFSCSLANQAFAVGERGVALLMGIIATGLVFAALFQIAAIDD